MTRTRIKVSLQSLSILLGLNLLILMARAGYQLEPIRLEVSIPTNKKVAMTSLRVSNPDAEPMRLRISLTDWLVSDHGVLQLSDLPVPGSVMDHIRLNPREFEIGPGARQVIRLAVSLPSDAKAPCEYHSMVMLEDLKTASQHLAIGEGRQTSLFVKKRIGVALYIYYGDPKTKPVIKRFQVDNGTSPTVKTAEPKDDGPKNTIKAAVHKADIGAAMASDASRPWLAHVDIANDGDRHSQLSGSVLAMRVVDGKETVAAEFAPIALTNLFILPHEHFLGDIPLTTAEQLKTLPSGHYRFKLILQQKNPETSDSFKAETEADL